MCRRTLLLGFLGRIAIADARRVVPQNPAVARSFGRVSGIDPIYGLPGTGLPMAGNDEVPDPFGVRADAQRGPLDLEDRALMDPSSPILEGIESTGRNAAGGHITPTVVRRIRIGTHEDFFAAENELTAIRQMLGHGVFLKVHDMWYRNEEESPLELVLTIEGYACTLKELLNRYKGKLDALSALDLIVDVSDDLQKLRRSRTAHTPPTMNDILIVGDTQDLSSCRAFLSSSLTNTDMRVHSSRAVRGRPDPRAQWRTRKQVKKADQECLEELLDSIEDALPDDEHDKLVELSSGVKKNGSLVSGLKQLRTLFLSRYPTKVDANRITKRLEVVDATAVSTIVALRDGVAEIANTIKANMQEVAQIVQAASVEDTQPKSVDREEDRQRGSHEVDYRKVADISPPIIVRESTEGRGGATNDSSRGRGDAIAIATKKIEIRTQEDFFAAKNELRAIRKMLGQGVFLKLYDMRCSVDNGLPTELVLKTKGYTSTLRELLSKYKGKIDALSALDLLFDIATDLDKLRRSRIAHDPPTVNDILIVGDSQDLSSCRAFLSSSLTNTKMRIQSKRATLRRVLTFRGPSDPRAEMRLRSEAEEADTQSLEDLVFTIDGALSREENHKLVKLSMYPKPVDSFLEGIEQLRDELIYWYPPQDGALRLTKRGDTADDAELGMARTIKTKMQEAARLMRQQTVDDSQPDDYDELNGEEGAHISPRGTLADASPFIVLESDSKRVSGRGGAPEDMGDIAKAYMSAASK